MQLGSSKTPPLESLGAYVSVLSLSGPQPDFDIFLFDFGSIFDRFVVDFSMIFGRLCP